MSNGKAPTSDAFVFFGATGDLAYKKIFPSLQAMIRRGHLDIPVIGVAKAGWNLDQFRARARDSLEKHGGLDEAVPTPVLTAALYERFSSRGEALFQDKLLSAMRFEFGGHVEKPKGP